MPFRSAFTLPAGTENLYVQTTLPDGTKSVKMVGAHGTVAVTGASMKAAAAPKMRLAANARIGSSMPDYPKMECARCGVVRFKAVITAIESGKSYQLGASWAFTPLPNTPDPPGREVAANWISTAGQLSGPDPLCRRQTDAFVAQHRTGQTGCIAGRRGEDRDPENSAFRRRRAAVYVFADGKLSVGKLNVSGKCIRKATVR